MDQRHGMHQDVPRARRASTVTEMRGGAIGRSPTAVRIVQVLWALILFDLHFFLGELVAPPLGRVLSFATIAILIVLALDLPRILASERVSALFAPFLMLVLAGFLSLPVAENQLVARNAVQYLVVYYILALVSVIYIKTPTQALPILAMFACRFLWWALWAGTKGLVPWHPTLANYDGFGGLMVMGAAICFWFALAVRKNWQRNILMILACYCVLGVVASMARGAFLALVAVALIIWWRSPRKGATTVALVVGAGVLTAAASLLFEDGFFIKEILSVFDEGTEAGTGAHRWAMWGAAIRVWLENPLFGVGAGNFGIYASTFFKAGEIEGFEDPSWFWGVNLHNAYFQILSELGLVGTIAFIWLMVDFVRKNRELLRPESIAKWRERGGAQWLDLRFVALGLESAMAGVFLGNMVYASLLEPWFATLWALNRVLWELTRSAESPSTLGRKRRAGKMRLGPVHRPQGARI